MGIGTPSPGVLGQIFGRHGEPPADHVIVGSGDLIMMSTWKKVLRESGFQVGQLDVYTTVPEKDLVPALRRLWALRTDGWWNLDLVKHGILTEEEFDRALKKSVGR